MTLSLRDFQREAIDAADRRATVSCRVLVVSPGGSGKTVMIAELARRALLESPPSRVLIVSHRREIIDQTKGHLPRLGVSPDNVGVVMGRETSNPRAPIQIASILTLQRRLGQLGPFQLVLVDEAHHVLAAGYIKALGQFPKARHIGFTATPFRMDGRGLKDFYDVMVTAALPSQLIASGFLARPLLFRSPEEFLPNLSDLKIARGDYVVSSLGERVNTREIVGGLPLNYRRYAEGKKAIAFAVNIEHSRNIVQSFLDAGIPAAHVDGAMPVEDREAILAEFASGSTQVLSNCLVLSEGYDLPVCEAVIMARPTRSLVLYIQQAARAMRPLPNKRAIVLDHARNLERFGLPDADRNYVLSCTDENLDTWNAGPTKVCSECGAVVALGTTHCPNCGSVFETALRTPPQEVGSALIEYSLEEKAALEERLRTHARSRGWGTDWVNQILNLWVGVRT